MSQLLKELKLKHSNNQHIEDVKWQLALEISKVGIWDFDAKENKVFFSKPSKAIIGFEDDDSFGFNVNDWNDRVHPEDREQYFKDFQDHLNGLLPDYENKHRVLHKDGTYRWVLDRGQYIEKNSLGEATRVIGTHVDITDYADNEQKIKETLDLIAKKNSKLQNFAHIVTHNLKQHAGNFESLLELYDEAEDVKEKTEMLGYMKTLSKSLTKTINDLSEIVSIQSQPEETTEDIKLVTKVNNVLKDLEYLISEKSANIKVSVSDDCSVIFNKSYLYSIVQNLVTNAIKYKHPKRNPEILIASESFDTHTNLVVKDNGIGINLDKFGKDLFGLYKTFHNNPDAEGVGLYLVKNQLEAFGGSVDVESIINEGTTFTLHLPNQKIQH